MGMLMNKDDFGPIKRGWRGFRDWRQVNWAVRCDSHTRSGCVVQYGSTVRVDPSRWS